MSWLYSRALVFQSTPLCEGRRFLRPSFLISSEFQSTPLCEGRRRLAKMALSAAMRFNPRPCVRGDYPSDFANFKTTEISVSIHAPV